MPTNLQSHALFSLLLGTTALAGAAPAAAQVACDSGQEVVNGAGGGTRASPWEIAGNLDIGRTGTCELTVENGGQVRVTGGSVSFGRFEGASGSGTVTGAGSSLVLPSAGTATDRTSIVVGYAGEGVMTIADGGTAQSWGAIVGFEASGVGTASVTGTGSTWDVAGNFTVGGSAGGQGTLTISAGGAVTAGGRVTSGDTAGGFSGSTGAIIVTGAGSSLTAGTELIVGTGQGSRGELTIADGGAVASSRGHVGFPNGSGRATVTGAGSSWMLGDLLTIASQFSEGEVVIADGGVIRLASDFDTSVRIAGGTSGSGRLEVTGAGSLLSLEGVLHVGHAGVSEAEMLISNGASVESGTGLVATNNVSTGSATVTGEGSLWTSSGGIDVGARGQLTIADAGRVHSARGAVGANSGGDGPGGVVTVTGAGSAWTTVGDLVVGRDGTGTLTIVDGGAVRVGEDGDRTVEIARGNSAVGNLHIGGDAGAPPGDAAFDAGRVIFGNGEGTLVLNHTNPAFDFDAAVSGSGLIDHRAGSTTFTGDSAAFSGLTTVNGGSLRVEGTLGGDVHVAPGAMLGGSGGIGGNLESTGGIVAPGSSPGTLTISGDLILDAASILDFELGDPAGAPGIASDLIDVAGNLTLDGTLNVTDIGGFGAGLYRLINYGGALTDNGLAIGDVPAGFDEAGFTVQTATAGQVNLVAAEPDPDFVFWDGPDVTADNAIAGGSGTWTVDGTNWTVEDGSANGAYDPQDFLIFSGPQDFGGGSEAATLTALAVAVPSDSAGTVTIDNAAAAVSIANGMQFAIHGYSVVGDALTLAEGAIIVRVGDGTAGSSDFVATIAAPLTGDGRLVKTDAGTLILTGANDYAGGTLVSGGVLQGDATSLQGDITVDATLVFDQVESGSYAGALGGEGDVVKESAGTLILTADSSAFAGVAEIEAGALLLDGLLGGTLRVNDGARLGGTGTAGSVNAFAGGTVAPGDSIGTLNVAGITFDTGSIYEVELNDAGFAAGANNDLIVSSGPVSIEGGTVHVTPENGTDTGQSYAPGTYTIVTGTSDGENQGVNGAFDGVTDDFAFLDFALSYDAANVFLTSRLTKTSFCLDGMTFNQCSTGDGAFSLGGGSLFGALLVLSDAEAPVALDQLSGEIHASARTALIEDSRFPREAALGRLGAAGEAGGGAWGQAFGSWGDWEGDGNAGDFDRSIGGFFVGGDVAAGERFRLGAFGGYSHASFDLAARGSTGSVESWHLGVYGGGQWGRLALRVGGAYAWHDVQTARSAAFTGFSDSLSATYAARTAQLFGELGYRFVHGAASFEPFANLAYVHLDAGDYAEAGGAAALAGAAQDVEGTFSTVGLRAQGRLSFGGTLVAIEGVAGWRHAFDDGAPLAIHAFAGSDAFVVAGVPVAEDAFVLDLGVSANVAPGVSLGISYDGRHGSGMTDHGLRVNFGFTF